MVVFSYSLSSYLSPLFIATLFINLTHKLLAVSFVTSYQTDLERCKFVSFQDGRPRGILRHPSDASDYQESLRSRLGNCTLFLIYSITLFNIPDYFPLYSMYFNFTLIQSLLSRWRCGERTRSPPESPGFESR